MNVMEIPGVIRDEVVKIFGSLGNSKTEDLDSLLNKAPKLATASSLRRSRSACPMVNFLQHGSRRSWYCRLRLINLQMHHPLIDSFVFWTVWKKC